MAKTDWKNSDIVKPDDMNQIGQEINHLYTEFNDRLDMIKTSDITLQPGLQVVNAAKDARFRLGEVRGKTLVSPSPDLLGGKGNFESNAPTTPFFNDPHVRRLDNGGIDNSKCLEIELTKTSGTGGIDELIQLARNKYYVAVAMIKNITTAQCAIGINGIQGAFVTSKEYTPAFLRFTEAQVTTGSSTRVGLMAQGAAGNTARIDNLRVYEISKAEYDALVTMTAEQVAERYPFGLIGIRGVDGPYAINTVGNLLPPFYEWTLSPYGEGDINAPYTYTCSQPESPSVEWTHIERIPVLKNTNYCLSFESPDGITMGVWTVGNNASPITPYQSSPVMFNTGDNSLISIYINGSKAGLLKNPMLTIGSEPKPFRPQRKSMLAFQTEMHANPVEGSDPDILFEQNGQYFKFAKWKKVVLDGGLDWRLNAQPRIGYKEVYVSRLVADALKGGGYATKFSGTTLTALGVGTVTTAADQFLINNDNAFVLTISNTDSGWGDDYSPSPDEIKAYFNGYKMFTVGQGHTGTYNGTGTKAWVAIIDISAPEGPADTQILPTGTYSQWTPYQLLYRLAKQTVEPVVSEGALLLTEGDNIVEVGTGIVLRERANVFQGVVTKSAVINSTYPNEGEDRSKLKHKVDEFLHVYKNGQFDDDSWIVESDYAYGNERLFDEGGKHYDQSAAYTVTYLKLDKSPIQPIAGTLAANEKAQISDLTAGVAEALQRVSVVEQKKAEKDAPGWITPTLLNGWTGTVMYKKMSNGLVKLEGQAVPGAVGTMFRLPLEFRPSRALHFGVMSKGDNVTKMAWLAVDVNGDVNISEFASTWVGLDEVTYLAGQ